MNGYMAHLTGLEQKAGMLNRAKGMLMAMQQAQSAPLQVLNIQLEMVMNNVCHGMLNGYRFDTFYTRAEIDKFSRNVMIDIERELEQVEKVRADLLAKLTEQSDDI